MIINCQSLVPDGFETSEVYPSTTPTVVHTVHTHTRPYRGREMDVSKDGEGPSNNEKIFTTSTPVYNYTSQPRRKKE